MTAGAKVRHFADMAKKSVENFVRQHDFLTFPGTFSPPLASASLREACIERLRDCLAVEVLSYEYELLHAVAVVLVPITLQGRILGLEGFELIGRHRGVPLPCIAERHLTSSLFEDIACVGLAIEPADTLGTNDALRPTACHELIEHAEV